MENKRRMEEFVCHSCFCAFGVVIDVRSHRRTGGVALCLAFEDLAGLSSL